MARTRRYMHGQRRRCSPFKHGNMPHPKGATGEEIDSQHSDIYGRDHNLSDHERWAKPSDTPVIDEEPTRKESRQKRREAKKAVRDRYQQAVREWKEGGKQGDKPVKP